VMSSSIVRSSVRCRKPKCWPNSGGSSITNNVRTARWGIKHLRSLRQAARLRFGLRPPLCLAALTKWIIKGSNYTF